MPAVLARLDVDDVVAHRAGLFRTLAYGVKAALVPHTFRVFD